MTDPTPILIALLVICAIWGFYYLPELMGGRRKEAPIASTERFDQWTHVMADVQRREQSATSTRDSVRSRRRRALFLLAGLSGLTLGAAAMFSSLNWLLASLAVDAVLAWYIGMLLQIKQREARRVAALHLAETAHSDEPPVRIVAGN